NTRDQLTGFPQREPHLHPLAPGASPYLWLADLLRALPENEKVLLITSSPEAAIAVQEKLFAQIHIDSAPFHDDLRLPQRHRTAAWFAAPAGARVVTNSYSSSVVAVLTRAAAALNERFPVFGQAVITLHELPGQKITLLDGPAYQEKIRPARIVFVYGWWLRTPNLVKKHGDKIRAYFRPVPESQNASRAAIEPLRRAADIVIGVHIRQGDYRGWQGGKFFFPATRYAAWMNELAAQFPGRKVAFFVCSDEPRHAGEFPGLTVGFGTNSPVADIFALALCDYLLGTKSTFSQWASFYGEKPLLQVCDTNEPAKLDKFRVSYLDWD
ncbi:MAG: alpha-1,2-fucosyltransferase, partial [Verrucomicrobiota bacterium]